MGQKVIDFCDACGWRVPEGAIPKPNHGLINEHVPVVEDTMIIGGNGNVVLGRLGRLGPHLVFKDLQLCPECDKKFKDLYASTMVHMAYEWAGIVEEIKGAGDGEDKE